MLSHLNLFPRKKHKPYLNMLHNKLVIILKLENGFLIKVFFVPFFKNFFGKWIYLNCKMAMEVEPCRRHQTSTSHPP